MDTQEIVTVKDRENPLLNRRELSIIIKNHPGQLKRADAASLIAGQFQLTNKQIVPIAIKYETGKTDINASFYVYSSIEDARRQLPRYMMLRNMSKEDRKKIIDEERSEKLKAKQAAAAEAKGGKGKK